MSSIVPLEQTIDKVLSESRIEFINKIDSAYNESLNNLESSRPAIQQEYSKIINNAQKQSESIKRQIIGASKISARNKQLLLLESAVNNVFEKAKEKLYGLSKEKGYESMLLKTLEDYISAIHTRDIIIECNKNDKNVVNKIINDFIKKNTSYKISISDSFFDFVGGIRVRSSDGLMSYDGTIDSRLERVKPIIRKNIAQILRA
jgi:V/A-type H+-transporting ATPase subunit E